ncbi:aspartyl-phosphate phosphatase Spo0E family protein [Clostridiaceae bacterium 35-E11]
MKEKNSLSQQEISKKIYNLRLKLNKIYKEQGNTNEVVRLSQKLDKYIVLVQQKLTEK